MQPEGPRAAHPSDVATRIADNISKVLEGKRAEIDLAVTALLARGHLLIEDVPGVGKTTLARALARSIGVGFRRLQCTSDLLPADVLGGNVYDAARSTFSFRPGPVFTQVLLADEINRTTPRTQSALLEAMDERRVSLDGQTHPLDELFFVVATQNPEEFHGTYALPESQLDRFLVRMRVGYPPEHVERQVLSRRRSDDPVEALAPVASKEDLLAAQHAVHDVRTEAIVVDYAHAIVLATRRSPFLSLGASTRAAIALERASRARALMQRRAFAIPDDVQAMAVPVLAHRVRFAAEHGTPTAADAERVLRDIVEGIPVPV